MRTQKTLTIQGNRYTAAELLRLDAYETNGGDMVAEIKEGQIVFGIREDYLAIKNSGSIRRRGFGLGDTVAILARLAIA
jgi:hypothetical protein